MEEICELLHVEMMIIKFRRDHVHILRKVDYLFEVHKALKQVKVKGNGNYNEW